MNTYVIAEIGQNHNGSMEMARALVEMAADPRPFDLKDAEHYKVSAVKFTKAGWPRANVLCRTAGSHGVAPFASCSVAFAAAGVEASKGNANSRSEPSPWWWERRRRRACVVGGTLE